MLIDGSLTLALPGININDIKPDFSVKLQKGSSGEITISKFELTALNGVLIGKANGNLIKKI